MGSSTYGAKLPFATRVFIWLMSASLAATAVQSSITLLVGVPAIMLDAPRDYALLMAVVNICIRLAVVSVVVATLYSYDKKEYALRGYSPFLQDLSLNPGSIRLSKAKQPAKEAEQQAWATH
jgi:hypothetical protein